MSRKDDYEKKGGALIGPIVEQKGLELVDIEYVKEGSSWYLRAYIDKPGGVNIGDCESVSREFSDKLDEADLIQDAYILEVSSPGLGRAIKKPKDFERNINKEIEFKSYKAIEGQKEFSGVLVSCGSGSFTVKFKDENIKTFNIKDMAVIKEAVEW